MAEISVEEYLTAVYRPDCDYIDGAVRERNWGERDHFGVPAVWVIDPLEKRIWIYRPHGMELATGNSIQVEGTSLEVPVSEIFD